MPTTEALCAEYESQLTQQEKKAIEIAKRCLESSFDMEKTIGFQEWLKRKKGN